MSSLKISTVPKCLPVFTICLQSVLPKSQLLTLIINLCYLSFFDIVSLRSLYSELYVSTESAFIFL